METKNQNFSVRSRKDISGLFAPFFDHKYQSGSAKIPEALWLNCSFDKSIYYLNL